MWELIRQNRRKSLFVLFLMFILMESFSILIFYMFAPKTEMIAVGALFGFVVWAIQALVAYFYGDKIVLTFNQAVVVDKNTYPRLFNVVEEMRIAGAQPYMPEIYLVEDKGLNAFATGIRQEKSAICVTRGLYEALNRDELQGVIAHEMSHILNRDVLFMTFAGVMLGTITMLSNMVIRGGFAIRKNNSDDDNSGTKKRGIGVRGNPVIILVVIAFAILAPILAKLFYFTISRKREFLADASAARLTRYPEGLASALEKISSRSWVSFSNRITSPMFIISPEPAGLFTSGFFSDSTHPPVSERIMILRKLQNGGSISLSDYRKIYLSNVKGRDFFPNSAKNDTGSVSVRAASPDEAPAVQQPEEHVEFIGDSTPSDLFKSELGIDPEADQEFVYTIQKPDDWESFRCPACGKFVFHLAPNIRTRQVVCRRCKNRSK